MGKYVLEVVAESVLLACVFLGIGITTIVFWHANLGYALIYPSPALLAGANAAATQSLPSDRSKKNSSAPSPTGELPVRVLSNVPFTVQAPLGNWIQPFKDACEEASVAMAMAWVNGLVGLAPKNAAEEILGQVAFENETFGYNRDTALAETLKIIRYYYNYTGASLVFDITPEDIERALAEGNVVIAPVSGTLLKNPFYISPPPYHMLVVVGYDEVTREFITNDPGTARGKNFRYPIDVFWNAIHDFPGPDRPIQDGRKGIIIVEPEADARATPSGE